MPNSSVPIASALPWFALAVKSRREQHTARILENLGFEQILPTFIAVRKYSDRTKKVAEPLFPGYVFCRFDPQQRLPILQLPYVIHIVGNCNGPAEVAREEIDALRAACTSGSRCEPWPYLSAGHSVTVVDGPLRGVTGLVSEVKGVSHLVLSVTLLQRSVGVIVRREWIRPVKQQPMQPRVLAASAGGSHALAFPR